MKHDDHVRLLRPGVTSTGGTWAELGSGRGAFTLALAELAGPGSEIYSVDLDRRALQHQAKEVQRAYPAVILHIMEQDFTRSLQMPALDGILMANSLHFVQEKLPLVQALRARLRPDGRLLIVEYNVDRGNRWVPYPLTFSQWQELSAAGGFAHAELLATAPSRFLGEFFAAASWGQ